MESNTIKPAVPPADWQEYDGNICSNWDGVINPDIVEVLKAGGCWAGYPAWDFYGQVWYDAENSLWCCKVMQYRAHIDTTYADSPEELIEVTSDKYGYE